MKVFVAFSVGLIPPVVEIFANETDRNAFAFGYSLKHKRMLAVANREVIEVYRRSDTGEITNG
jgi:hypothetical protein